MNIINGGVHANNSLRIQEYMIRPDKAKNFKDAVNICFLVIQKLKILINNKNLSTTVGDEGGFAPTLANNEIAIELIIESIRNAGYEPGKDVCICLDIAANELFKDKKYAINSPQYISANKTLRHVSRLGNAAVEGVTCIREVSKKRALLVGLAY